MSATDALLSPGRLFCFGLGFSAAALARRRLAAGWSVAGTTRSPDKAAALRTEGVEAFVFDRDHALDATALAGSTHLLVSIAPDDLGDPVLAAHAATIAVLPDLRWVGYLSTTGVYGRVPRWTRPRNCAVPRGATAVASKPRRLG